MLNKLVPLLIVACFFATPVVSIAQEAPDKYAGLEHLRIDHDKLKTLSRDEQRTYMRAIKQAREDWARESGLPLRTDQRYVPLETPRKVEEKSRLKVAGTNITYDTGTVTGGAGIASQMLGNRFDVGRHATMSSLCCFPVEASGSITMITFNMTATFFGSAFFSLYSDISGTMAMQVTSMARTGLAIGLNTFSVMSPTTANAYMNGTFLAGIWQSDPTMTALAVDTGTTGGQGFHAISINDGAVGTMLATVTTGGGGGLNAIFRVTGDLRTLPVELMRFKIED